MNMRNRNRLASIMLILLMGAMVHSLYADGYRNPPPTAEGIAKSGANSVFVDDASAISYNPANLALQTDMSIVIGTTYARTENTYSPPNSGLSFQSDGDWNMLANMYFSQPIGDKGFAWGLGINTPYGQGISWNQSDFAPSAVPTNTVPYEAAVMLIDINPTVAFKVSDSVSIGIGLDIYYSELELKAIQGVILPSPPFPPNTQQNLNAEGEGSGWGIGANAGVTWLTTEGQRLALTFRSGFEMDYSGDFKVSGVNAGDFETTLKYPNSFGLGYGIELSETVQIETLVEWQQWSVNDTQSIQTGPQSQQTVNNWDDTFTFGLGGSWDATDWLIVRGGYAFIPSPIPDETITPLLPDADRHALSFGLGFAIADHHMIDLAYTYSIYSDRASPITGTSPGTYDIDSNLIGLTYSFSF